MRLSHGLFLSLIIKYIFVFSTLYFFSYNIFDGNTKVLFYYIFVSPIGIIALLPSIAGNASFI